MTQSRYTTTADRAMLALLALGATELILLYFVGRQSASAFPGLGLVLFFSAFATYVLAATLLDGESKAPRNFFLIWLFALAFRAVLLPRDPVLSDDIYRYLWDGYVQLQGVNPYRFAPGDPALAAIRTEWHHLINNPSVPTIYPPLTQFAFVLIALGGGTIVAAKTLWLTLDLATGALLWRIASRTGRPAARVLLLYLWSPLLVVETAWSGHLDVLGLLMLAILLSVPKTAGRMGAMAGLATLAKFAPAAAFPPLFRRYGLRFGLVFGVVVAVFYLPYLSVGPRLFTGLATYAEHWRFNEGAYAILEMIAPAGRPARYVAAAIVLAVVGWTTVGRYDAERALFWILGAGLLLSPTVHPWYVLWALPFAALRGSRAWILLTGTVFLGYWGLGPFQSTGEWPQPLPVRLAVWVPFFALLAVDAVRAIRSGDIAPQATDA